MGGFILAQSKRFCDIYDMLIKWNTNCISRGGQESKTKEATSKKINSYCYVPL